MPKKVLWKSPSKEFDHQSVSRSENCTIGFPLIQFTRFPITFPYFLIHFETPSVHIEGGQSSKLTTACPFQSSDQKDLWTEMKCTSTSTTNPLDKRAFVKSEGWVLLWCLAPFLTPFPLSSPLLSRASWGGERAQLTILSCHSSAADIPLTKYGPKIVWHCCTFDWWNLKYISSYMMHIL